MIDHARPTKFFRSSLKIDLLHIGIHLGNTSGARARRALRVHDGYALDLQKRNMVLHFMNRKISGKAKEDS